MLLHHIALHNIRGCRRLLAATVTVQHRTLPEEGYDAASYLIGYGGSGHAYALYLQTLRFTCFEVVDMRSFFSFQEVVYLLNIMMLFTSLCC